ncbi:DedA family protein [Pokkaliibacter sp. CJK22405]|uniref:DedA family protein n=1 Tax=Pokkaliibacter sp. CJK22405 TaxID=3384615 RepID=UPI003984FCF4
MFSGLLGWLTDSHQLMTLLQQNWLLGLALITAIIFCETGLVVFPFLPGDSLLFATGAFLGASGMSPVTAILCVSAAAVLGDSVNYWVASSPIGQQLVKRNWVKPQHLKKTQEWFDRFGGATIIIGRFIPIVRTIGPFLAGLATMNFRQFILYNIMGGLLWCCVVLLAGFWLGAIPWVRDHLEWFSLGIVVISLIPVATHAKDFFRSKAETDKG